MWPAVLPSTLSFGIISVVLLQNYESFGARVVKQVGGDSWMTKYDLRPGYQSENRMRSIQTQLLVILEDCLVQCHTNKLCLSLNYNHANKNCSLFDDKDPSPVRVNDMHSMYATVLNREGVKFDCVTSNFTDWSVCFSPWNPGCVAANCSGVQTRNRSIIHYPAYGGLSCKHLFEEISCIYSGETHILIIGGRRQKAGHDGYIKVDAEFYAVAEMTDFDPQQKSFKLVKDLKTGRYGHAGGLHEGQIIVNGGHSSDGMIYWGNTTTEIFSSEPVVAERNVTIELHSHSEGCGGVINSQFYHCFGISCDTSVLGHCDVYDLTQVYARNRINTTICNKHRPSCVTKENDMYVIGGKCGQNVTNELFKIDLSSGVATQLNACPVEIWSAAAVWFAGDIVVCGGLTPTISSFCYKYIVETDEWEVIPSLIYKRHEFKLVNWGVDKILAIGGVGEDTFGTTSIELFENGNWSTFANMTKRLIGMEAINLNVRDAKIPQLVRPRPSPYPTFEAPAQDNAGLKTQN